MDPDNLRLDLLEHTKALLWVRERLRRAATQAEPFDVDAVVLLARIVGELTIGAAGMTAALGVECTATRGHATALVEAASDDDAGMEALDQLITLAVQRAAS